MPEQSHSPIDNLITEHIDIWSSAIKRKSSSGRGSSKKIEMYGIKKLRELILELAVRGKLVSQDPNDEPASVLLERIAQEKAQLVKEGKIKKPKKLPEISEDEKPFELPDGWGFVRFIDVLDFSGGGQPPKSVFSEVKLDGYVQLIQIRDLGPNPQPIYVPEQLVSKLCNINDVMVGRYGASVGKVFWGKEGAYNVALIRIHNDLNAYSNTYIYQLLKSPLGQRMFTGISRSAQDGFNKDDIAPCVLPLPPVSEQHRIVAKVDELMVLCDQLEAQTESSLDAHQTLVTVLLDTLVNSQNAEELEDNWARISGHFDTLFTTEQSIDQLKQTILQLAVMGKLVEQNPNDEPASELLKRIAAEKAELIKQGKIKKQKPLPPITEEEKPFELPKGWEWVRFASMSNEVATGPFGSMIHKHDYVSNGIPLINPSHMINSEIHEDLAITVNIEKAKELRSYKLFENDIVMARRGEMGRCALVTKREENWLCGTGSFVLRFNDALSRRFILLLFRTSYVCGYLGGKSIGTTMTNLNHSILNEMPLLLPPVTEQHRIVAKVDELMAICDQLKAQLSEAQTTQLNLADALVEQAL